MKHLDLFAVDHCRFISHREHSVIRENIVLLRVELILCIYFRKAFGENCDIQIAIDYEMKLNIYYIFLVIEFFF